MKILTIIGARPQFIKASVISRLIKSRRDIEEVIVHSGQHFDNNMSDIFFEEMDIPKPNYNLNVHGVNHGAMTGQMLEKIETVLLQEKPDWVVVYGDTNTTLAGALAARKLHIKLAHIEAGLRSYNMDMPEEINRILTDRISNLLFCPTAAAILNLEKEGYKTIGCKIINSGDVMQDAAIFYTSKARKPVVDLPKKFILCTIHRAENTDNTNSFKEIFDALEMISLETTVVFPLHPRTKNKLNEMKFNFSNTRIQFIEPMGYLEMVYLLKKCNLVMTDSGGLQKEAYFFKKPCLTLREETEWVELVENGFNKICGSNKENILSEYRNSQKNYIPNLGLNLYGDGHAGEQILEAMKFYQ